MGMPYQLDRSLYEHLINNEKSNFTECASITCKPGTVITCSVACTDEIQNTVSISNNEGKSYYKSYGKIYSKGDATTTEINESLQLASAFSISNSTHENEGNRYTESLEKVHGVINTESLARTDSREDTHTETVEHTTSHMVTEEYSHTLTHNKDLSMGTSWGTIIELSHNNEISRIDFNDFEEAKKYKYKENLPEVTDIDNRSEFEESQIRAYHNYVYPLINVANGDNVFKNYCNSAYGKGGILPHYLICDEEDDKKGKSKRVY